jgi:hypothetical protein
MHQTPPQKELTVTSTHHLGSLMNRKKAGDDWAHGRLVARRPEISNTALAKLNAIQSKNDQVNLDAAISNVIADAGPQPSESPRRNSPLRRYLKGR